MLNKPIVRMRSSSVFKKTPVRRWQLSTLIKSGLALTMLVSLAVTSGCYPDRPEHSGTASVEGEVFLDGFPLDKANVVFVPSNLKNSEGKFMPLVYGKSDIQGMFEMRYADGSRDIMAGDYHVLISLVESKGAPNTSKQLVTSQQFRNSQAMAHRMLAGSDTGLASRAELIEAMDRNQVVPALYNRESNLKYEVIASPGTVRAKFELSSVDPLLKK